MKIRKMSSLITVGLVAAGFFSQAQTAFHRYSLLVGVTGGPARAIYSTRDNSGSGMSDLNHRESIRGEADPLVVEFGVSNRIGVGFSLGGDAFRVDPTKFYGYRATDELTDKLMSTSHYFTADFYYHPYVTKKVDVSAYVGFGSFKVNMTDYPQSNNQTTTTASDPNAAPQQIYCEPAKSYDAKGSILRVGVNARYYFWKRLGVMGMLTTFSGAAKPKSINENSIGSNYSTIITGYSAEFGLCVRFF
jgi:hypothetical protein